MAALQDDLSFDQRSEMRGAFMHVTARFSCDDTVSILKIRLSFSLDNS